VQHGWRDVAATSQPQRMVSAVLHLVLAARRLLRAQHVRRRHRRKLPQVSRDSGAGGQWIRRTAKPRPQTSKSVRCSLPAST